MSLFRMSPPVFSSSGTSPSFSAFPSWSVSSASPMISGATPLAAEFGRLADTTPRTLTTLSHHSVLKEWCVQKDTRSYWQTGWKHDAAASSSSSRVRIKWRCNTWRWSNTCSFAVQTQIATRELPWTTDEDSHCADVTTEEGTTTLTEKHKTENISSTHVQILCSSTESPCTCHCTVKLYPTPPWMPARATSNMPRVEKVPTRSRCEILKACQILDWRRPIVDDHWSWC